MLTFALSAESPLQKMEPIPKHARKNAQKNCQSSGVPNDSVKILKGNRVSLVFDGIMVVGQLITKKHI